MEGILDVASKIDNRCSVVIFDFLYPTSFKSSSERTCGIPPEF
jgi:hypothetical protein